MLNRQSAFEGHGRLLKGGLHCHTTRSDGRCTPEEVLRIHRENGYDFLAITDHRRYNLENFAPETGVTVIPGMEFDSVFEHTEYSARCFHTVCLGPDDGTNGFRQDERFESGVSSCQEEYQSCLDRIHAANNLTVLCHPQWSCTPVRYFERLRGNFAMELWNTGSAMSCCLDTDNGPLWDELLAQGQRIWGVAADDGHQRNQHCRGWVMVNAENSVSDILRALAAGSFYSSCGPVLRDFYEEDGRVYVSASPCSRILLLTDGKTPKVFFGSGDSLTDVSYELRFRGKYHYIRAEAMDSAGRRAWTNPIFFD